MNSNSLVLVHDGLEDFEPREEKGGLYGIEQCGQRKPQASCGLFRILKCLHLPDGMIAFRTYEEIRASLPPDLQFRDAIVKISSIVPGWKQIVTDLKIANASGRIFVLYEGGAETFHQQLRKTADELNVELICLLPDDPRTLAAAQTKIGQLVSTAS